MTNEAEKTVLSEAAEGLNLIGQLMTASMDANIRVIDNLYEQERNRRLALEVHIQQCLKYFDQIALGTVREYERGVSMLSKYYFSYDEETAMAERHRDYKIGDKGV